MISQEKLDDISQIVNSMEQGILRLEKSFRKRDKGEFESAKKGILELQKKLSEELK